MLIKVDCSLHVKGGSYLIPGGQQSWKTVYFWWSWRIGRRIPGRVQIFLQDSAAKYFLCSMSQLLYIKRYIKALRVGKGGEPLWKHSINPASGNKLADIKTLVCSLEISSYVIWYLSKTHEFAKFSWEIFWAKAMTSHLWKQRDIFHSCQSIRAVVLAVP